MSCCACLNAQDLNDNDRYQQQLQVEKKIEAYIQKNFETAIPEKHLYNYIEQLRTADEHTREELTSIPFKELMTIYKKDYLRSLYFKENPKLNDLFKAVAAVMCDNGGFENSSNPILNPWASYAGQTGIYNNGECGAIPTGPTGGIFFTGETLGIQPNHFSIVTPGLDAEVAAGGGSLNRVNNGRFAARINADRPADDNGNCTPRPERGTNKLIKAIILQEAGIQEVNFSYALVAEFPDHPNQNPFFIARAVDAAGNELDRICVVSNPATNPFFNRIRSPNGCRSEDILWQDWTCGSLTITGAIGEVVNLEFIVADCGAGAHFGYAYVDDICTDTCDGGVNTPGNIELTPMDPCQDLPLQVCGTYTLPQLNGNTGSINNPIELEILQGGVSVGITLTTTASNGTFCFTVNASDMVGQSGGYDFQVNADFTVNGGTQADSDIHTNPGQDNDFIFDNPDCCPEEADFNAFIDTSGLLGISSFTDYSAFNPTHEWYVLSSPNAVGGPYIPVHSEQNNGPVVINLITNAQPGLYYTVIHILKTDDCGDVCESKVLFYNDQTRQGEVIENKALVDCCLALEYWANGPGQPSSLSAEFQKALDFNNNITTNVINPYTNNPSVIHSWELYSSPNQNGGPYTLVDSQTGLNYSYGPITDGIFYFILHKVQTDCGEVCYVQDICSNCGENKRFNLAGEIDCDFFTSTIPNCEAPARTSFDCSRGIISWTGSPSFNDYVVEYTYNDPNCRSCFGSPVPFTQRVEVTGTSLQIPIPTSSYCLSYRVGTKCPDTREPKWTALKCVSCRGTISSSPTKSNMNKTEVSPNPSNGLMNFNFQSESEKLKEIQIHDISGVLIDSIEVIDYEETGYNTTWDGRSNLETGMYFVSFITSKGKKTEKVIIK